MNDPEPASGTNPPYSTAVQDAVRRERFLRRRDIALAVFVPIALLVIWEAMVRTGVLDRRLFPPPSVIAQRAVDMIGSGELLTHFLATGGRVLYGTLLGIVFGVIAGLAMGRYRATYAAFNPTLSALYALPKVAIFPLLLILFGLGETPRVLVVAISVFFVVQINTMAGVRHVDPRLIEAGKSYGATGGRLFWFVIIPAASPSIFAGLRIAAGVSVLVIVAVEFVAANSGLGFLIWNSWTLFQPPKMFVGLATVALFGAAITGLVALLEGALMPWNRRGVGRKQKP